MVPAASWGGAANSMSGTLTRWKDRLLGRPDLRRFARTAMASLREQGVQAPLGFDEAEFALVTEDGTGRHWYLRTVYDEWCSAPRSLRARILQRCAAEMQDEVPATLEAARAAVVPIVRTRAYFALGS